jgi:serine/threonine-protein kinase
MEKLLPWLARIPAGPVVAVIAVLGIMLMSGTPSASQRVPELEGLDVNTAIALAANEGFFTHVEFKKTGGVAGTVIRQEPEELTIVNKRSTILLHVTKGVAQIRVPDVRRLPVDEARRRIEDAHLEPGAVTYQDDPEVEHNRVISSSPSAGTSVDVGATVDIVAAD